ncbi:nucleotide excision repair TFIIH subunit [Pyrrhoderma noxium]|uniref:General transcription and DNA repair factor IIH subunit TFB5 n=1 Tax=Pyrrhoderma noxium TaxID=2282107 RepID=A0A286UF13_9AGAM|nr:nucleotide excision repair TFIIH subunit [Pyrrhoderma noxium]
MKAIRGILLTCDAAVKQILLSLNEKQSFIIEDLDDFHVVIKADEEFRVRRQLEVELEKNTYSLDQQYIHNNLLLLPLKLNHRLPPIQRQYSVLSNINSDILQTPNYLCLL